MAKVVMKPIASYTSTGNSVITFSNISGYKDLRLVVTGGITNDGYLFGIRVNSDSGSNYGYTIIQGDGSSTSSGNKSNMIFGAGSNLNRSTLNNLITINFSDYANNDKYKSWLSFSANAQDRVTYAVSTWRSTSPITSISIAECGDGGSGTWSTGNILSGSIITLYGIE